MEKFTKPEILNFLCDDILAENPDFISIENKQDNGTGSGI